MLDIWTRSYSEEQLFVNYFFLQDNVAAVRLLSLGLLLLQILLDVFKS